MNKNYLNIYNTLINYTRNKELYTSLKREDNFSDRLSLFLLHFAFFLKNFKNKENKDILQEIYDFNFKQLELSIREIGYGDQSINKKMKEYLNLFHNMIDKFHFWDDLNKEQKKSIIGNYTSNSKNTSFLLDYFENFLISLKKNTLNSFIKSVIKS